MEHHIVIGANYGDEGKGLMTDYLVRKHGIKEVVRFNGGAQAGHTVVDGENRQVFSSFGSGTLAGAFTRHTSNVILNPSAALMEAEQLKYFKKIKVSSRSPLTTPLEMMLNQLVEEYRGSGRHGSCGMGINETVTRHLAMKEAGFESILSDDAWSWIGREYLPRRIVDLGLLDESYARLREKLSTIREQTLQKWGEALEHVYDLQDQFQDQFRELDLHHPKVFEGAQGLALDEEFGIFPYVTRSKTGIRNAITDIINGEFTRRYNDPTRIKINIYYMTRAYITRHGAGPLHYEMSPEKLSNGVTFGDGSFKDETNAPNPWQGALRFAPLDIEAVVGRIQKDMASNAVLCACSPSIELNPSVVITCLDQFPQAKLVYESRGTTSRVAMGDLPRMFSHYGVHVSHISTGPSANDIIKL